MIVDIDRLLAIGGRSLPDVVRADTISLTNRILFAGVHGIRIVDGRLDGGADPGRDGLAMAV